MGLSLEAKNMTLSFDIGYCRFMTFRSDLVEICYGKEMREIYEKQKLNESDIAFWNERCDDDLDLFFLHSDCDGKLTPKECRKIFNKIKMLSMNDMASERFSSEKAPDGTYIYKTYNMLERLKEILLFCAKRRVNLYFI